MIFDAQNMFFDAKPLSAGTIMSDVISVGVGESYEPMKIVINVPGMDKSKAVSAELQTAVDEAFSSPVKLADFAKAPCSGFVPRGNLGYLRLKVTSTSTTGRITAGLVFDDEVK